MLNLHRVRCTHSNDPFNHRTSKIMDIVKGTDWLRVTLYIFAGVWLAGVIQIISEILELI